ncbi:MAG: hypothetical protein ABJN14_12315 [Paracoccaceae bacterium]
MTLNLSKTIDWNAKRGEFAREDFSLTLIDNLLTEDSAEMLHLMLHTLPGWHQPDWGKDWFDLSSGYQQLINPKLVGLPSFCKSVIAAMGWPDELTLKGLFAVRCNGNSGLLPHADNADFILNLWTTPDRFNRQIGSGGMTVWNVKAPTTAAPEEFTNAEWVQSYLNSQSHARKMQIPYQFNRAILFDAKLFHTSQPIDFEGIFPKSMRTNLTFAFALR